MKNKLASFVTKYNAEMFYREHEDAPAEKASHHIRVAMSRLAWIMEDGGDRIRQDRAMMERLSFIWTVLEQTKDELNEASIAALDLESPTEEN